MPAHAWCVRLSVALRNCAESGGTVRMRCHPIRWLWGLIPIAMLSWIAIHEEAGRIERDLEQRSSHVLRSAGHDWASVVFSGRDGVLVGTAQRPDEPVAALTLVRRVWGVRTVEARTRLASEPEGELLPSKGRHAPLPPGETAAVVAAPASRKITELPPLTGHAALVAAAEVAFADVDPTPLPTSVALALLDEPGPENVVAYEQPTADRVELRAATDAVGGQPNVDLPRAAKPAEKTRPAAAERKAGTEARPRVTATLAEGSAPTTENRCRRAVGRAAASGQVRFPHGRSDLNAPGRALLDRLAVAVDACPQVSLRLAGHADAYGAAQRNLRLSRRRAKAAVMYLIEKGIDAGRLEAVGYGETRPAVPNDSADNRAKNRRVEVEIRGVDDGTMPTSSSKM